MRPWGWRPALTSLDRTVHCATPRRVERNAYCDRRLRPAPCAPAGRTCVFSLAVVCTWWHVRLYFPTLGPLHSPHGNDTRQG